MLCVFYAAEAKISKLNQIKVAIIAPFSGNYSDYGEQLLSATTKALSDLKAIDLSIDLEVIPFDDRCNYTESLSIAKTIVKDLEIKAVITHTCAANNLEANKIYAKHRVLQFVPTSTSNKITETGITTLFRLCGKADLQVQSISNFLAKNFMNKKIAILHTADPYNQELAELIQESLATFNIFPTLYQSINATNFSSYIKAKHIIKKMKKLQIDLIIFPGFYREIAQLIKYLDCSKTKIPIITSDAITTPDFFKILPNKKIAIGTIITFPQIDINLKEQAMFGYAAMQILYTAIQKNLNKSDMSNQKINSIVLANWLHHNKIHTILGEKSWDTNGDIINGEFNMYVLDQNGYTLLN